MTPYLSLPEWLTTAARAIASTLLRPLRCRVAFRNGLIAPFRVHRDRGCLPPTTGAKRPGVGYSESGQNEPSHLPP